VPVVDDQTIIIEEKMPQVLALLLGKLVVSRYVFFVEASTRDHPRILAVGGVDRSGEKTVGFFEIRNDTAGHAYLGSWTPFDDAGCSCWLMDLFQAAGPRVVH
jgi:hypothetical protein